MQRSNLAGGLSTRRPRMQIQIMELMAAVAVLAIVFCLPSASTATRLSLAVAVLVLLPTALAPRGHRAEVAFWTMALHPLMAVMAAIGHLQGARIEVPRLRDLSRTYRRRAIYYAEQEQQALWELKEQRECLAFWSALATEREKKGKALDSPGHSAGGPDAVESRAGQVSRPSQEAAGHAKEVAFWERRATYYARMRRKWQRSAICPWLPVEPDPPEPEP
jgi:hypothetical protein